MKAASVLSVLVLAQFAVVGAAWGQHRPRFSWGEGELRFVHMPMRVDPRAAMAQSSAGNTLPMWKSTFTSQGLAYQFIMVGTDPSASPRSTTIVSPIVPLVFTFADGTVLDPTLPVCGGKNPAVDLTQNSPIFKSSSFTPGGTNVGTTQYVDAFQRANFWNHVATSPGYHVRLRPQVLPAVKVIVPPAFGHSVAGPCSPVGLVDINWFSSNVELSLAQSTKGIEPKTFPIFLGYNVVMYSDDPQNCCIAGFHDAVNGCPGVQTLAVTSFLDSGVFSSSSSSSPTPAQDVGVLSHEVAEWMDDPLGANFVPPWGGVGQVPSGNCQNSLEDADPLSDTGFTVTGANQFVYHLQDLAFLPWFAQGGISPSTSVNGWWSFLNTFGSFADICPPPTPTPTPTPSK